VSSPIDPLDDAWKRIDWAERHGQTLHTAVTEFSQSGAYAVGTKREGDRWRVSFHRLIDPSSEIQWFDRISNLLGAFLDGFRASLNYLAYEIALLAIREDPSLVSESLPYRDRLHPEWIEFPIFIKKAKYNDVNPIRKLPAKYRDAIEAVQPYDGDFEGLWMLQELAAQYRHRIVHPIAMLPFSDHYGILVNGDLVTDAEIELVPHDGPLKHGDVVMYFTVDADADANVNPQVAISPGIDNPVCAGRQIIDVLNVIKADVGRVFRRIEPTFFAQPAHVETTADGKTVFVIDPPT